MTTELRPGAPAFLADPFATYARLRDDDPAHWSHYLKAWVLTRYDDVKRVCLDSRMSSDRLRPFFRALIAERRREPRRDLLSELVHLEDDGERLSEDELVATCVLLLFAGHETTTHHITNGLAALLRFPAELEKLRRDPARAPAAVEELLRYDGPIGAQVRIVQQPQVFHGRELRTGDRVFLMMNAANRDPRAYADPDRLDLDRHGPPHLTFGFGAHICLGFPLARLEGQIALPAVLARWREIEPAVAAPQW